MHTHKHTTCMRAHLHTFPPTRVHRKNWERIQEVLKTLGQLTKVILSLMALIGLFLYIFTIWGLRVFGNRSEYRHTLVVFERSTFVLLQVEYHSYCAAKL